jgi:hypothetical protein
MTGGPLAILVPEAHAIASIACIRSLGRAGHRIIAYAQDAGALGLASRYAAVRLVAPGYADAAAFERWLAEVVREHRVDAILPSEGLLLAIRPALERYLPLMPLAGAPDAILASLSKHDLFASFARSPDARLMENLPGHVLVERGHESRAEAPLARLRTPLYLKVDGVHAAGGDGSAVRRFDGLDALRRALPDVLARYARCMVQEHVEGAGVGAFFLRWKGEVIASLMHRRLHEVPYTGGQSSLRETWWNDAVYADAARRLEALDWQGVGMLEYRWDPASGAFRLMEFNARFWGSLHLALFAGVDFPALLIDAWRGRARPASPPSPGLRCRLTFPKEIEYVASRLKARRLGFGDKLGTILEFFALGLDPRVRTDLWFPGDTGLYWRSMSMSMRKFLS